MDTSATTPEKTGQSKSWFFAIEERQFNQRASSCLISLELSRIFDNVFTPSNVTSAAQTKEQQSTLHLVQPMIDTVTMVSDFTSPFPTISVKFTDVNLNTLKYINDGFSKLSFFVTRQEYDQETTNANPVIVEEFIINVNKIAALRATEVDADIIGVSSKQMLWQTPYHFAYKAKDEPQPASMILDAYLKEFIKSVEPRLTYESIDLQNANNPLQTSKTHSSTLLNGYVTPANMTVKNNVDYLLLLCSNADTGLFFVKYNELTGVVSLGSLNQMYTEASIKAIKPSNLYFIPTEALGSVETQNSDGSVGMISDKEVIASNVKTYSNIGGIMIYDILSTMKKNTFNSMSRKWSAESIDSEKLSKYFPKANDINSVLAAQTSQGATNFITQAVTFEESIKKLPTEINKLVGTNGLFSYETVANSALSIPHKLDVLSKNLEIIEFTVGGNLDRAVGDLIVVTTGVNVEAQYARLAGIWTIMRLVNIFHSNNLYEQVVFAVRTSHVKIDAESFAEERDSMANFGKL